MNEELEFREPPSFVRKQQNLKKPQVSTPSSPTYSGTGRRKRGNRYTPPTKGKLTKQQALKRARNKRGRKARRTQRRLLKQQNQK
jgi:hypothetical protein